MEEVEVERPCRLGIGWILPATFSIALPNIEGNEKGAVVGVTTATPTSTQSQQQKEQQEQERSIGKSATHSNLWLIHGQEYNLADFVHRHPGGKEAILLGQGRDCTALFESYHSFTRQNRYVPLDRVVVLIKASDVSILTMQSRWRAC
jgi:cytochrome b involved in lipid metabolism